MLLEEIKGNEFDSATNTNDGMSDENDAHDASEQFIVADHLTDDGKEYFESNGDQMIEISTNGEISESNYQYVFQEDSADEPDDDDEENSSEMPDDKLIAYDDESYLQKDQSDGGNGEIFDVKTTSRSGNRKGNSVNEHKELFVRDGKIFQCLLCQPASLVVYDTKTISIHLKTDHNERIYVCSDCGLDFRKRNPYNDHMDEHTAATADGTYECEICKISFSDARQFRIHKKTHSVTTKIWPCKACGKKFSSKNLLDEHMNMHTGER